MIGGIAETQEMLDFCAEHDVAPEIEVIAADYVNEAYERVLASDVRYRFVIDTESLRCRLSRCRSTPDSGHPAARELGGDPRDVLRAGVVMGDLGDEGLDLVVRDLTVAAAPAIAAVMLRTTSLIWSSVSGVARSNASSGTRSGPGTPSG